MQLVRALAALLLTGGAFAAAAAQQVPLRDLPKPSKEIDDPFSLISGAREFRGGQLVVADGAEVQLSIIDFAKGTRVKLGRQGAGPGEYTSPLGIFRLNGDTIWVWDSRASRIVAFLPDGTGGTTFPMVTLNSQDSTVLNPPFATDLRGMFYASAIPLKIVASGDADAAGGARADFKVADSSSIVRFDPRVLNPPRTKLATVRTPSAGGGVQQQVVGTNIKITSPFPGFVLADAWTVFPDGRVAVVRGATYRVEFISPDGKHTVPVAIPYEHFKFTEADRKTEMDAFAKQLEDQKTIVKKMVPAGYTIEMNVTPPTQWPAEYPPLSLLGALAAPDGRLWVKRGMPERIGREQWDVIDPAGKLVARWQLPPKTNLIGLGLGVVYAVRKDEDDLRYVQRIALPACTECR